MITPAFSAPPSIALVRAAGFGDLPGLVETLAGERRLAELFQAEGLPMALRDMPATPMPLRAMASLFERSRHLLDDRAFGLEVGTRMTYRGYGLWAEYAAGGATLGEALRRGARTSRAHASGARLELVPDGDGLAVHFLTPALDIASAAYCDHMLPPLLSFIRFFLGADHKPERLHVAYARDAHAGIIEDRLGIPLLCGQPGTGLSLRLPDLAARRPPRAPAERIVTLRDVRADVILADAPDPAHALSAVVALRLLDGQTDIEGAARMVGLGMQGLQRRLRQAGWTYREVIESALRARAQRLLIETELSVLEIALSLGYETHASFTRAFTRWMGCPPSDYRRQWSAGTAARP